VTSLHPKLGLSTSAQRTSECMATDRIEVGQRREPLTYITDNQSIGRDKSTAEDRQ